MISKSSILILISIVGISNCLTPVISNLYASTKGFAKSSGGSLPMASRFDPNRVYSLYPGYGATQSGALFAYNMSDNSLPFVGNSGNLGWFYGSNVNQSVETEFIAIMSNDDMFTWSGQFRSDDGFVHINIIRNLSTGNPKNVAKTFLPGSNESANPFNVGYSSGAVLPDEKSALLGFLQGYYYIDFSNLNNIVSTFFNISTLIPNLVRVQGISILKDNVTVIFSYVNTFGNPCFQETTLLANHSISLGRSTAFYSSYPSFLNGITIDNTRNVLYCAINVDLLIVNLTSFTVALQFNFQGAPWFGSGAGLAFPPWISPDGLTACITLIGSNYNTGANFIVNTTNINNIKIINSFQPSTNFFSSNWCQIRPDGQAAFVNYALLFNTSSASSPLNTLRSYTPSSGSNEMLIPFPCDNTIMIACGKNSVRLFNIANPNAPVALSTVSYGSFSPANGGLCDHVDLARTTRGIIVSSVVNVFPTIEITEFNNTLAPYVVNQFSYSATFTALGFAPYSQYLKDAAISPDGNMLVGLSGFHLMAHNISNPLSPVLVANMSLPDAGNGACNHIYKFRTRGSYYIVNCALGNAFLIVSLNVSNGGFSIVANLSLGADYSAYPADTAISGDEKVVYVSTLEHRLFAINVTNLSNPIVISNLSMNVNYQIFTEEEIVLSDDESTLLLLGDSSEIAVFNIAQPSNMQFLGFFPTVARAGSASISYNNGSMILSVGDVLNSIEIHNFGTYSGGFLPIRNQNYCNRYGPTPAPTPPTPPTPQPTPAPTPPTPSPTPRPTPSPTPPTPQPTPVPTPPIDTNTHTTTIPETSEAGNTLNIQSSSSGLGSAQTIVIAVVVVVIVCCIFFIILVVVLLRLRKTRDDSKAAPSTELSVKTGEKEKDNTIYSGMQPGEVSQGSAEPYGMPMNSSSISISSNKGEYQSASELALRKSNAERVEASPLRTLNDSELIVSSQQLGKGAFGIVYAGSLGDQKVAVKEFTNELPEVVSEARMMSSIPPHPNVVTLIGVTFTPKLRVVTELMAGGDLRSYIRAHKNDIKIDQKMIWISGIANGMEHLIKYGILHRDLAARNVLLDGQLNAKVSDFGLSKVVESKKDAIYSTSNVGPLRWMAPEALDRKKYSEKSDVWSWGVVCYEIICEVDPYFEIDDAVKVAGKVMHSTIKLEFPKGLPNGLNSALSLAFSFEPEDRPTFAAISKLLKS